MLLSEDHPQFLQTRRGICIWATGEKGHTSYCENCLKQLKDGVPCSKLAVFAISTVRTAGIVTKKFAWTDLIPWWNRTAHYHLNWLPLVVCLPDGVHIRKKWNAAIDIDGEWVILYLFAHCATAVTLVRFMIQAKEVSFLDFVRSKDRRAVEPIVRLTRPKVLDLLADVNFVIHTLAPQK